jgi:predicted metal-dependent phosphoesterase TrpH
VTLVTGVEISVTWNRQTIHVVGLNLDPACAPLQAGLQRLREFRNWRATEIARRLAKRRIGGALDGAARFAHGAIVSRTHFARFLVAQGHVLSVHEAFQHYLSRGRPGYVPGQWASLAEAAQWIRGAGGRAVIAHPGRYKLTHGKLKALLTEFIDCGGEAIEVISGSPNPPADAHYQRVARDFDLKASIGSDYHGPENAWVELGRLPALPAGLATVWEDWDLATSPGAARAQ